MDPVSTVIVGDIVRVEKGKFTGYYAKVVKHTYGDEFQIRFFARHVDTGAKTSTRRDTQYFYTFDEKSMNIDSREGTDLKAITQYYFDEKRERMYFL